MAGGTEIGRAQEEEATLLEAFRQGAPDAFESLFRLHQRAVYGWILRMVRDRGAAEDLTIETFFRIYRAHARFDPGRGFEAWARTIATRVSIDWMRAEHPQQAMTEEFFADVPGPERSDPAVSAEIRDMTARAFERLPPKLRIAAVLAVVEELPHREIAAALEISVAAVKVRVFRALRLLRSDLEKQGIRP